jgi:hypothetical protein
MKKSRSTNFAAAVAAKSLQQIQAGSDIVIIDKIFINNSTALALQIRRLPFFLSSAGTSTEVVINNSCTLHLIIQAESLKFFINKIRHAAVDSGDDLQHQIESVQGV